MHIPQYILSCGHSVYNTYIKMFKKGVLGTKYIFYRVGFFTALIKLLTCGVRIFSINGSGIKKVVPLKFFILL